MGKLPLGVRVGTAFAAVEYPIRVLQKPQGPERNFASTSFIDLHLVPKTWLLPPCLEKVERN